MTDAAPSIEAPQEIRSEIPPEILATFQRQRRLGALLLELSNRGDLAERTTAAVIPLHGPVQALLRASGLRHLRRTRRIGEVIARHVRRETGPLRQALDEFLDRAHVTTDRPWNVDPVGRATRMAAIMEWLTRWDILAEQALGQAAPSVTVADGSARTKILQNELASDPARRGLAQEAGPMRDERPEPFSDPRPNASGDLSQMASVPPRRGAGTLDDPLIPPCAPHRMSEGLAPGRIPTIVIDSRSPPLFGPARDDWFREVSLRQLRNAR